VAAAAPRRWGFHRLDSDWAATLVAEAGVGAGDLVLDVGAGVGALTRPLVECGARVVAVELHAGRATALRRAFPSAVTVVRADAADLRLPRRPFRVVANPPFAATTGLLRRLTAPGSRLVRADVVVPWHVADRWASPSAPGARRWQREFDAHVARRLPRGAFCPPAPGGVAVLVLRRRPIPGRTGRSGSG
jgi:23S rRNA (adenine-N6)-dimethyltransferase